MKTTTRGAVACDGDGISGKCRGDEVGNDAAVRWVDAWAVGVEDARNTHIGILLKAISISEGLRYPFALVVAGSWSE